ncbi:MAG: acetyltransferase [Bryobacterales bacterium]|nr:acetyltransferase [Bryobacterales bacterium]
MIVIRPLATQAEFAEAVRLQQQIWGFDDIDVLPVRLFVVAAKVGGQVLGAFDGDRMAGFCLSIPGIKPGRHGYLHSHMMGVLGAYRDLGVGRQLKLRQRADALSQGINLVEWTFDPLEIKNAYFNIERLGAVIRRYVLNQYGITSSRLQGNLPTDRCVAEWWIATPRVAGVIEGRPSAREPAEARIEVPAHIAAIRAGDPKRAARIQQAMSEQFLANFRQGLAVTGFERTQEAGVYLFTRGFEVPSI